MSRNEWTLTQISNLLNQPQYRLIYLCEKGVIIPDGSDAKGRGSSRRFSARNLFEFVVALKLGEFHMPTKLTTNVLRALRSFDRHLGKSYPMLKLPYSLRIPNSPEVKLILINGSRLYFSIETRGEKTTYIGDLDLLNFDKYSDSINTKDDFSKFEDPIKRTEALPMESEIASFKLNLSQIAKNVPMD